MEHTETGFHCGLCELCESVAASDTIESLVEALTAGCMKVLNAKAAVVRLLDEKHEKLELASAKGVSDGYAAAGPEKVSESPLDAAVIQGKLVEIPDVARDKRWTQADQARGEGLGAVLAAPLCLKDRCIGVLYVYYDRPHAFSEPERGIARTLAAHAGIVLARLRIQREAHVLEEISQAVNSSLEESQVLGTIVRHAAEVLGFKAASIRMLDEDGDQLQEKAAYGLSEAYLHKGPVDMAKSPLDQAVLAGEVITVTDGEMDARLQYPEEARREGVRSILCLPLVIKGRPVGVLRVYTSVPYRFTQSDIDFLKSLANHGAIAMENARLFEHLRRDYADLTRAVWKWYDWGERPPKM